MYDIIDKMDKILYIQKQYVQDAKDLIKKLLKGKR